MSGSSSAQKRPHEPDSGSGQAAEVPLDRHCQQGLQDGYAIADDLAFFRVLDHRSAEERPYREREGESKTVCHWGQRKLMLAEIEFLTEFYSRAKCVVYAGAAPGTHILFLAQMFPKLRFVLVDPRPFSSHVIKAVKDLMFSDSNQPRIELHKGYFSEDWAKKYAKEEGVLFISDVRTSDDGAGMKAETRKALLVGGDFRSLDPAGWHTLHARFGTRIGPQPPSGASLVLHPSQQWVEKDMELQQTWHLLMQPLASSFKFRLPWGGGATRYLKGEIFLPVWGPVTTTESRLFVESRAPASGGAADDETNFAMYDNGRYERQMFYFNTHRRIARYKHDHMDFYRCSCFDCTSESSILAGYFAAVLPTPAEVPKDVAALSQRLDRECHRDYQNPRTLFHGNPDPAERKQRILKRQKRR